MLPSADALNALNLSKKEFAWLCEWTASINYFHSASKGTIPDYSSGVTGIVQTADTM
jgi:hypothetical protein